MASRTVSVTLTAQVSNYLSSMRAAESATRQLDNATKTASQRLVAQQQAFAKHNEALTRLGQGFLVVGATAAAGLAIAIKASAEFGAKMAELRTLSGATAKQMETLSAAAMTAGAAFGYNATQVADAEIELTKAGRSAAQMLGGDLKGALTLAAVGQIDVAKATQIGVSALTQFAKTGATIPQVADALAAGSAKALGSVDELGMALQQGGLVAAQMGLDLNDTVGTLSAFAQAGLLGSDAGTSLKSALLALQSPSKQAQEQLDKYNITAYDAQGNFVGIADLAGQLQTAFEGQSQASRDAALSTIFGSDAIRSANILYSEGKDGIQGWVDSVDDTGYAAAQAAGKLDSLKGDAQKLAAMFQTDLIKAGSGANDGLRALVQTGTNVLEVFGQIPGPVQTVAVTTTALVAVVGLAGGAFLVAVPKVVAFQAALTSLGVSMKATLASAGLLGGAVAGMALLMSGEQAATKAGIANTEQISAAADALQGRLKNVNELFKGNALVGSGIKNAFDQELSGEAANNKGLDGLLLNMTKVGDVYRNHEGAFSALGSQLAGLSKVDYTSSAQGFQTLSKQVGATGDAAKQLKLVDLLAQGSDYKQGLRDVAKGIGVTANAQNLLSIANGTGEVGMRALAYQTKQAAAAAQEQGDQLAGLAGQASSATTSIDDLQAAIEGFGSAQLDARSSARAMEQAIDDATAAAAKNGRTLKIGEQAGRDNAAALDGIATAATQAASKTFKQTGSMEQAEAVMQRGRDAFVKVAQAMGKTGPEAEALADKLELIPNNIPIAIDATGADEAIAKAAAVESAMKALNGQKFAVELYLNAVNNLGADPTKVSAARFSGPGADTRRAAGGQIDGQGPKGVDSVRALLAPGEHVLTTGDVDALGGQAGAYAFRRSLHAFAAGGAVNGISHQTNVATQQQAAADQAQAAVKEAKAKADAARKRADRLSTAASDIDGKEENKAAKKAAKAAADAADKQADRLEDAVDTARKTRDAARERVQTATEAAAALRLNREDFVSAERRDPDRAGTDPLSYVDQLRSMSRDDNYSDARRKQYKDTANAYERSLSDLTKQAAAAATKLQDLQSASDQMRDSISSGISGGYSLAGGAAAAGAASNTGDWFTRDGIRYQQTTTGGAASAAGLAGYFASGATNTDQFATALQQLANRGVNSTLLAQLAGMGTADGLPIAQAILNGSDSDLAGLNQGFSALQTQAGRAGSIVADANYGAQIAAANANTATLQQQLKDDGEKLRHLIATAFGLPGYATGTRSAAAGIRWVGENGPELAGFGGGEAVLNAPDSSRWIRGGGGGGGAPQITVQPTPASFPDTITVQDLHGFTATMRVVATQEIAKDAAHDAVLMMGASA